MNPEDSGVNPKLMSLHSQGKSKATPTAAELPWTHNRGTHGLFRACCPVHEANCQPPDHAAAGQSSNLSSLQTAISNSASSVTASPAPALGLAPGQPVLPGTVCLLARGGSVLLHLVLLARARKWLPP